MVDPQALLAPLNDAQRLVATSLDGPVRVLAGAGTGKTRAITHRVAFAIASGIYRADQVLMLTFTAKSAAELRSRLRDLGFPGVTARTFHSTALEQLREFWPEMMTARMPGIVDSKAPLLAEAIDRVGLSVSNSSFPALAGELEWRKVRNMPIEEYVKLDRSNGTMRLGAEAISEVMIQYENVKADRRVMDFEDVLLAAHGMLLDEPGVAERLRARYRTFVVDEYQDVSPIQQDLLDEWLGRRRDICVVGDASQTIYTFTGASSEFLVRFEDRFPDATQIELDENYRSSAPILGVANSLMRDVPGHVSGRSLITGEMPAVAAFATDDAEARAVAADVMRRIQSGTQPNEIAVLTRLTDQIPLYENELFAAGAPVRLRGAPAFFARPDIAHAISMIGAVATNPGPGPKRPARILIGEIVSELRAKVKPPLETPEAADQLAALDAFVNLIDEMPATASLEQIFSELKELKASGREPVLRSVTVSTIHAAKGLEWDQVYVIGLADGILPISYAMTEAEVAEERRLLYVALTRARRQLRLSWAYGGDSARPRNPSPFLAQLGLG